MDWQTAILIGIGFVGGVVTTGLLRTSDRTAASTEARPTPGKVETKPALQGIPPENPRELAYQRLSQLERFKSGFLARTAHELRSPINSVIGLHQLILEGLCETPDEEKQFTAEAKDAAYKVLQLFDTIIAASKLDIGREVPFLEPVALAPLFTTLQELTQLQAANRNLRLTFKPTELSVNSDLKWLQMLLISLIDDAITSTQLGDIILEARAAGSYVLVSLEADRPVDDLTIRLDTSLYGREVDLSNLSSVYLSTGLTLAVAQEMVTALHGKLLLPAAGEAPIITVKLPAAN